MTGSTPVVNITFPRPKLPEDSDYSEAHDVYDDLVRSLLALLTSPNCSVSSSTAASLDTVEFSRIRVLFKGSIYRSPWFRPSEFREKVCLKDVGRLLSLSSFQLPLEYRDRIIHRSSNLLHFLVKPRKAPWSRPYILGRGRNKVVCWRDNDGACHITWVYHLLFWHLIMVTDFSIRKMINELFHWIYTDTWTVCTSTSITACFW